MDKKRKERELLNWLMEGDAAVRWQVFRDLKGADRGSWMKEQAKVAGEGWGARLLAVQDEHGMWGGGLYTPKWTSTTYTLLLLWQLGLPQQNPKAQKGARLLLDMGCYRDGGISFSPSWKRSETCITGMVLGLCSYFRVDDRRLHFLADYLSAEQMADGGWNCQSFRGARHSSFHTTVNVLEGLHEYEKRFSRWQARRVRQAQRKAVEFLLQHRLFKSHRTGDVVDNRMTRLSFPPRWHYDILRILDYLQEARFPCDGRMGDALEILLKKRLPDGCWPLQARHPGRTFFELEETGAPSRINTLRALRVLRWFDRWY